MSEDTQRNTAEVMDWYDHNSTHPPLTFDPDGMCLAICRIARNIASRYPSALSASLNTPKQYRIYKIEDLRAGHVMFFDDPNDSNPFGHIATVRGRVPTKDLADPHALIVETNAVVSNRIVKVRADYFKPHWGDSFTFGASWLNGEPFYDMQPKPKPPKKPVRRHPHVRETIASLTDGIKEMRVVIKNNPKHAKPLQRDLQKMIQFRDHLQAILDKKGK